MDVLREKIKLPRHMMRRVIGEKELEALVKSIKEVGIINPIVVRKMGDDYELIAGLRRLMAADVLQMETVCVRVVRAGDGRAERIKMDENKERVDINPIDEGEYILSLMKKLGLTQKQMAGRLGVSESYISQRIGAVKWPDFLRDVVCDGKLTFSVAREFAGIKDLGEMRRVIDQAIRSGVSPAVAARWRHEVNREVLKYEGVEIQEGEVVMRGADPSILYSCQICGGPGREVGYQYLRICNKCLGVIKVGQEKGVFVYEEEKEE